MWGPGEITYSVSVTTASEVATELLRRPAYGRRFFDWQHNRLLLATHA
jgi:hypothetical protein